MRTTRRALVPLPSLLTRREQDVLHGLAQGFTNKEMARWLCVSEQTVASHLKALFRKLEVHNRVQAVRMGEELGLLAHRITRSAVPGRERPRPHLGALQKSPK